jgi:uncharacterized protein YdeI (YjbR/CyaY-like superfamily)
VTTTPTFFKSPAEFNRWLKKNHANAAELWIGYYKKETGKPSLTWPESVAEALCYGWIDGLRKSLDAESYTIRFTPRKPGSVWSAVNIRTAQKLIEAGRMQPAGLAAYEARKDNRSGVYGYEQRSADLPAPYARQLKANKKAWAFWQAQGAYYRKTATWWVVGAKKEETRLKRLVTLIDDCAHGRTLAPLTYKPKAK